uniref:Uncharacterized protein n=1 Tax=Amphimedon queenslandica TaxID=400682 RepID=A0A1X7SIG4_AMPQE
PVAPSVLMSKLSQMGGFTKLHTLYILHVYTISSV